MIQLAVCPSTLAPGFNTYSPLAQQLLFDGKPISHCLSMPSPSEDNRDAKEAVLNAGRISLSGVQPKFSLLVDKKQTLRYTHQGEQGIYILKPKPNGYHILNKDYCTANEHLTMQIAAQAYGIKTAVNGLCFYTNGEAAYLTRRFDVYSGGKYPQEDFAALLGYTKVNGGSDYKYCNASYEECAEIIRHYVKKPEMDLLHFFQIILFNFISLNDDAHLKNFSLLNQGEEYHLAPAYDLINTSLHLLQPRIFALEKGLFREGMALGDTRTVCRNDFKEFGRRIGLAEEIIESEINRFTANNPLADELIDRSFLSGNLKREYRLAMAYRRKMLSFTD